VNTYCVWPGCDQLECTCWPYLKEIDGSHNEGLPVVELSDVLALCRRVVYQELWDSPELQNRILALLRAEGIDIGEEAANGDEGR
jgi:hypothetical protein